MKDGTREVMGLIFEFLLSVLLILVSSFMMYKGIAIEFYSGLATLVVTFWFVNRSNTSAVNNLLRQPPVAAEPEPVIVPVPAPVPVTDHTLSDLLKFAQTQAPAPEPAPAPAQGGIL